MTGRNLFFCSILCSGFMMSCADSGSGSASEKTESTPGAAAVDKITVKPGAGMQCVLPVRPLACSIKATDNGTPGELSMKFERSNQRRIQRITFAGVIYIADGALHKYTNASGAKIDYSVNCSEQDIQINAVSSNSENALSAALVVAENGTASVKFKGKTREHTVEGSGQCEEK